MDTQTKTEVKAQDVEARLQHIKAHMPETYKAIQVKAGEVGKDAFRFVRRGVAGQPNAFYAIEAGHVVGTPFDLGDVQAEIARLTVQFGISFLIMWAPEAQQLPRVDGQGGDHGAR